MTARLPFNKRQRRRMSTHHGYGHRPRNAWGGGDLPGPYAEGDIVYYDGRPVAGRMRHMEGHAGHYVVCTAFSVDEGDAWYMRVQNDTEDPDAAASDRLHVFYPERSSQDIHRAGAIDYMSGFRLVDTADPDGLAERERLIAAGWKLPTEDPPQGDRATLGFTILVEASDAPGVWYPPMTAALFADEDAATTERDQWESVGRKARVVRCVTP